MISQVKNSNRSHRPQIGLTVLTVSLLTALAVFFTACKGKEQPVAPYLTPGSTENPNWGVSGDNDLTASMTAIVKISFTDQPGILAAFIGNDCFGIAEYKEEYGLYWLYIAPATKEGMNYQSPITNVQLKFYSPNLKRIFVATSTLPFVNDTNHGTIAAPYTPSWTVAN